MDVPFPRSFALVAILLASACGSEPRAAPQAGSPQAASTAPAAETPAPPPPAVSATPPPAPGEHSSAPTAADSAAAAAEDVSPEWKRNTRAMAPHASCMEQARAAPAASRPVLEAACGRLPDAPGK
ncbi:MAG TPA: hypothetical protein VE913_24400 [Longimicrobium sp.]|nr:hypothetical protein [Longimicrobium sp.]